MYFTFILSFKSIVNHSMISFNYSKLIDEKLLDPNNKVLENSETGTQLLNLILTRMLRVVKRNHAMIDDRFERKNERKVHTTHEMEQKIQTVFEPAGRTLKEAMSSGGNELAVTKDEMDFDEFEFRRLLRIRRHVKVTKAGRIESFSGFIMIGNMDGSAALGYGKAPDAVRAVEKAFRNAQKYIVTINRHNERTIPYAITQKFVSSIAILRPLPPNAGIRAAWQIADLFDCFGVDDIFCKVTGRRHPEHMYTAIFNALCKVPDLEEASKSMGKKIFMGENIYYPISPYT